MTDLTGNHPDMIAQVKQDTTNTAEHAVNDWNVAKFEQILAQETAAIDLANTKDLAAKMSFDKLFEAIGVLDENKANFRKAMQDVVDEMGDKQADYKAIMSENDSIGKPVNGIDKFGMAMSEIMKSQTEMQQLSSQHLYSIAKSNWVKAIAQSAVSSVKNTITRTS